MEENKKIENEGKESPSKGLKTEGFQEKCSVHQIPKELYCA